MAASPNTQRGDHGVEGASCKCGAGRAVELNSKELSYHDARGVAVQLKLARKRRSAPSRSRARTNKSAKCCIGLFAAGSFVFNVQTLSADVPDSAPSDKLVTVAFSTVVTNLHHFVLLRRGQHFAAVRFLQIDKTHEATSATVFHSAEATYSATYECYSRDDGAPTFTAGKYAHFVRSLSSGPIRGIGRWAVRSGNTVIHCGSFKLPWITPTAIGFERAMSLAASDGTELAPTAITEVERIDGNLPCVAWYRHAADRKPIELRFDRLCQ
jgi:hypothetical protein